MKAVWKTTAASIISLLIVGCASPMVEQAKQYKTWEATSITAAQKGDVKWSDHYRQAYDRLAALPSIPGKADVMRDNSAMIGVAQAYERGQIDQVAFESSQREMEIRQAERRQGLETQAAAHRQAAAAAVATGLQNAATQNANFYQQRALAAPPAPYVNMNPAPVNCLTQPSGSALMTACR
jgi:hypothetical protein